MAISGVILRALDTLTYGWHMCLLLFVCFFILGQCPWYLLFFRTKIYDWHAICCICVPSWLLAFGVWLWFHLALGLWHWALGVRLWLNSVSQWMHGSQKFTVKFVYMLV